MEFKGGHIWKALEEFLMFKGYIGKKSVIFKVSWYFGCFKNFVRCFFHCRILFQKFEGYFYPLNVTETFKGFAEPLLLKIFTQKIIKKFQLEREQDGPLFLKPFAVLPLFFFKAVSELARARWTQHKTTKT